MIGSDLSPSTIRAFSRCRLFVGEAEHPVQLTHGEAFEDPPPPRRFATRRRAPSPSIQRRVVGGQSCRSASLGGWRCQPQDSTVVHGDHRVRGLRRVEWGLLVFAELRDLCRHELAHRVKHGRCPLVGADIPDMTTRLPRATIAVNARSPFAGLAPYITIVASLTGKSPGRAGAADGFSAATADTARFADASSVNRRMPRASESAHRRCRRRGSPFGTHSRLSHSSDRKSVRWCSARAWAPRRRSRVVTLAMAHIFQGGSTLHGAVTAVAIRHLLLPGVVRVPRLDHPRRRRVVARVELESSFHRRVWHGGSRDSAAARERDDQARAQRDEVPFFSPCGARYMGTVLFAHRKRPPSAVWRRSNLVSDDAGHLRVQPTERGSR